MQNLAKVLASFADETRTAILADADLLILGAYPSSGAAEPALTVPEDCCILVSYPQTVPPDFSENTETTFIAPTFYRYRLK